MTGCVDQGDVPVGASAVEDVDQTAAHPRIGELPPGDTHRHLVCGQYVEVRMHIAYQGVLELGPPQEHRTDVGHILVFADSWPGGVTEKHGLTGLLIEVDDEHLRSARRQGVGEVERQRRLAGAALGVGDGDDFAERAKVVGTDVADHVETVVGAHADDAIGGGNSLIGRPGSTARDDRRTIRTVGHRPRCSYGCRAPTNYRRRIRAALA